MSMSPPGYHSYVVTRTVLSRVVAVSAVNSSLSFCFRALSSVSTWCHVKRCDTFSDIRELSSWKDP